MLRIIGFLVSCQHSGYPTGNFLACAKFMTKKNEVKKNTNKLNLRNIISRPHIFNFFINLFIVRV